MDTRSYKTISANRRTVDKKWLIIDVQGKILGRAASQIASLLRGKHKPSFTPHVDCGDNIIVINAEKVRLTGNKLEQKEYIRFSGYPGGQHKTPAKAVLKAHPERLIEYAVKGMIPKNRLGRQILGNLRVYAGSEHPHDAQNPEQFEI
jgi:large subunit ribosomal protein L13